MSQGLRGAKIRVVCIGMFCFAAVALSAACSPAAAPANKAAAPPTATKSKPAAAAKPAAKPAAPAPVKSSVQSESKPVAPPAQKPRSVVLPGWEIAEGVQVETIPVPETLKGKAETAYRLTFPAVTSMTNVLTQVINKAVTAGQTATESVYLWAEKDLPLEGHLVCQVANHGNEKHELKNLRPPSLGTKPQEYHATLTFTEAHQAIRMVLAFDGGKPITICMAAPTVVVSSEQPAAPK